MIYQTFIDSLDVEDGEYSYPEYYGGAYIDSSNNMVFNTIDDSSMVKNDLQKRANSTNFIVRSTQHAYRDLRTTVTEVTQLMDEAIHGDEIYSAIRLCMLMDKDNMVEIHLNELSEKNVNAVKSRLKRSDHIIFKEGDGKVNLQANILCGQDIYPNQYANWDQVASTGFRAIRNNENGFISAEHVLLNGAPVYNSSGNSIGTTTFLSKDLPTSNPYRAKSEVGFFKANSGYTPTNTVVDGGTIGLTLHTPVVGQFLFKYGAKTGLTGGYLLTTAIAVPIGVPERVVVFYGADYNSDVGDSGALVYRNILGTRFACGIHSGVYDQSGVLYRVFTLASDACAALSASRY